MSDSDSKPVTEAIVKGVVYGLLGLLMVWSSSVLPHVRLFGIPVEDSIVSTGGRIAGTVLEVFAAVWLVILTPAAFAVEMKRKRRRG